MSLNSDEPGEHLMGTRGKAFADLGDVLGTGLDVLMQDGDQYAEVPLDQIFVDRQMREEFEDEDNTLDEMEASIRKHGVLQPVLIRPMEGGPRPYMLVAGERRYIGSERAGKTCVPALIRVMTDDEAADAQMAENIQRKNLTQIELAKRIQFDLDMLGSVDAVLQKHAKGRAWLSKILALLTLPEQTKRLVTERISADLEVINKVKIVERLDPLAAQTLVNELKEVRGKADARKMADAIKEVVKPLSRPGRRHGTPAIAKATIGAGTERNFAGAKSGECNGASPVQSVPRAEGGESNLVFRERVSVLLYESLVMKGGDVNHVLAQLSECDQEVISDWLEVSYDAGLKTNALARAVLQGFRLGTFAVDDGRVFALLAFLQGADATVPRFDLGRILGCV